MMTREMSGWMSVSDEAGSPLVLFHKALQVYRVNWLRAKVQMDRWQEEVTLVQNETRWMHLWLDYHRNIWEERATESEQNGLKDMLVMLGSRCGCGKEWQMRLWMSIVGL